MPNPGESRPLALDQPTRQQLDELDELMQRMLALPVGGPEEPAVSTQQFAPVITSQPSVDQLPSEIQSELEASLVAGNSKPASPQVFEEFRFDPPPVRRPAKATEQPHLEVEPRIEKELAASAAAPAFQATVLIAVWWLQPLLWCNQIYDRCTSWLGGLGRWLRASPTRALLGWTGVLMLLGTGVWVAAEWISWNW